MGRALRAIHDGEKAAAAVGVDTSTSNCRSLSSAPSSRPWPVFSMPTRQLHQPGELRFSHVGPDGDHGGHRRHGQHLGALLGASLLTLLPEWLHAFSDLEMVVYGLIMMGVMIVMPQGLTRGTPGHLGAHEEKA